MVLHGHLFLHPETGDHDEGNNQVNDSCAQTQ